MSELILGIETSCDDTSVALVGRAGQVIAQETLSQFHIHAVHGGVYPELASRAHLQAMIPCLQKVLDQGGIEKPQNLNAIAATRGPGLIGSLLVGFSSAQALSLAWDVPLIGVNHLRGHIRSVDLEESRLIYPAIVLLVSGGHSLMAFAKSPADLTLLGTTRDDSLGECYDKVARMLGLGMPGGPAIDRLAAQGQVTIDFPKPMINSAYDFSFSGLKSSVARFLEKTPDFDEAHVATSFVEACLSVLKRKCLRAIEEYKPASLAVVGGVAASPQVRNLMQGLCDQQGVVLCLPPLKWATDNAAMIALAGWTYLDQGWQPEASVKANLSLEHI